MFSRPYRLEKQSDIPEQYRAVGWVGGRLYLRVGAILIYEDQMIAQLNDVPKIVRAAEEKFAPDVIRIRYHTGFDWNGEPAVFFRILLSDAASRRENLGDITERVHREILDEFLRLGESEYYPYTTFRNKSEQDKLKDPQWE